jgi:hypothetical protein
MMLLGLFAAAQAADPVDAIGCARAVHFATPYAWHWSADPLAVVDATALVVRADPELLRPRAVGQPVLYVEGWPAEVLWQGGDTALVLAPLGLSGPARAWFGDDTLPERVDAAKRKAESAAAEGLERLDVKAVGTPLTWTGTRRALVNALRAWMGACTG